jgi:hypothetical protein
MPGRHQDKKRGEEENGATDGSQHPVATFCVREKEKNKRKVQRNRCGWKHKRILKKLNFDNN